jgi:hypothetical protein
VLTRLAELKTGDRAAWQTLRAKLKKAGCLVTDLEKAIARENGEEGGRGPSEAEILLKLASTVKLFHSPDGPLLQILTSTVTARRGRSKAKGFRNWLARQYHAATKGAACSEAFQSALTPDAQFDAPERKIHVRNGSLDGKLYIDLADDNWRAIEIDAKGVVDQPPSPGMLPLVIPARGGKVATQEADGARKRLTN